VLGFADLNPLRETARGRRVLEHTPPAPTALRLGGDTLMAVGGLAPQDLVDNCGFTTTNT
jgi:hypothetical protein